MQNLFSVRYQILHSCWWVLTWRVQQSKETTKTRKKDFFHLLILILIHPKREYNWYTIFIEFITALTNLGPKPLKKSLHTECLLSFRKLADNPKTHKRFNKTLFKQTRQDRMNILRVILFFKPQTLQKQTMKGITYLLPVGFFQLSRMWAWDWHVRHFAFLSCVRLKGVLFNLVCVFDLFFSECWQSTLRQIWEGRGGGLVGANNSSFFLVPHTKQLR